MTTLETIRRNAQAYRRRIFRPDGSITIGGNFDSTINQVLDGFDLLSLSTVELQEVGYLLMHMSRNQGLNLILINDYTEYWSLVDYAVRSSRQADYWIREHNPLFSFMDRELINLLQRQGNSPLQINDAVNKRYQNLLLQQLYHHHDFFPSVWAGFAYLEGLCRRICNDYVNTDGTVKKAFRVDGKQYRSERGRKRARGKYKGTSKISNLHRILELTRRCVSQDTRRVLAKFLQDYSAAEIFEWRNDSLHGSENRTTTIVVLYCLISILLLDTTS
jgi:hypothetical protein